MQLKNEASEMKRWVSIMNLCTAWNISVFRSYENDIFPYNNKSILMSILLLFGKKVYKFHFTRKFTIYEILMVFTITCIEGTLLSYIIDIIVIYTEYMPCTC
jgi:F0F1-type ATP synthase gamma subunit